MLKNNKYTKVIKYLIIIFIIIGMTLITETLFNINAFKDNYSEKVSKSAISVEGAVYENNEIILEKEESKIFINVNNRYVNKLSYDFAKSNLELMVNATISVEKENVYGNYEIESINDNNPYLLSKSIVRIDEKVKKIIITFPNTQEEVRISNIQISNEVRYSKERMFFFFSLYTLITVIILTRKVWCSKPENVFLIMALSVGTVFVWLLPASKTGWDEEAHFKRAYTLPITSTSIVTPTVNEYGVVSLTSWPYNLTQSKEEKMELAEVLNCRADYRDENYVENFTTSNKDNVFHLYNLHYIPSAIGIKIGQLLNLNFYYVYILGRWFNLIAYSVIVFFAIKKLNIAKNIMAAIALMPTPIFLASTYSYDAIVTALIFLGIAYLISELIDKANTFSIKNMIIALSSIAIGSLAKAVYIPIVLIGLLFPKEKFKNKKQYLIFKISIIIVFLLLMSTFVLPSIISPSETGDIRGGNTSTSGQMKLIFSQPLSYFTVFIDNVKDTFLDYTIGKSSLGLMGHISSSPCISLIIIFITALIFTDSREDDMGSLTVKEKVGIGVCIAVVVALIWTALYLSFTEVGKTQIAGVQGRYYIPLLFLMFLLIRPTNIKNKIDKDKLYLIIYGLVLYILFKTIYECILLPYNL